MQMLRRFKIGDRVICRSSGHSDVIVGASGTVLEYPFETEILVTVRQDNGKLIQQFDTRFELVNPDRL